MTNTNATYATSIAVDLPDYPAATVTFTNTAFFVSGNSEVLPGKQYTLTLNSTGQGTQTLPCPDNTGDAAVNWRVNLPSKESGTYAIAYDAATQQLSDILAAQTTTADPDAITAALAGKMDKDTDGTAGNLTILDASKNAVDAGYAATQSATGNSVVKRTSAGQINNTINSGSETAIFARSADGYAVWGVGGNALAGVRGDSQFGSAIVASSSMGTYAIELLNGSTQVSGIRRVDGVLEFVGVNAVANRAAQRTELGLGTAALAATGDFDAAGSAAAAQAAAVQRANHTGTQLLSTISDAGTMAAQATTSYYTKTDHSAAPVAAEPVKADGSGGVQIKSLAITGNDAAYGTNSLRVTNSAAATVINTTNDGRTSFGAKSGNNSVVDINLSGAKTTGTPLTITAASYILSATTTSLSTTSPNFSFGANSAGAAINMTAPANYALSIQGNLVGVNTSIATIGAQLQIGVNAADVIGQIIKLAASQTANALEVRSSAGAVLAKIEPDGEIQAAGYRSSDGTAGWTGTFLNGSGATVTVKNGLITGVA